MKGFEKEGNSLKKKKNKSTPTIEKTNLIKKAISYHLKGNILEAKKSYEEIINRGINDPSIYSNYGVICQQSGEIDLAIKLYRKCINFFPNHPDAYANLGTILTDLGKVEEAKISINKAINLKPDFPNAYANLASLYKKIGQLKEAEKSIKKSISLSPNNAIYHLNLGEILKDFGKLKESEKCARQSIELNPKCEQAYFNLADILYKLENPKETLSCYLKFIEIFPANKKIYPLLSAFLKNNKPSNFNQDDLSYIFNLLIRREDISHRKLSQVFNYLYNTKIVKLLEEKSRDLFKEESFEDVINDSNIILTLKNMALCDTRWERALSNVRRNFCIRIANNKKDLSFYELRFIIALAEQCFLNEYVYSTNKEERECLEKIINRCNNSNKKEQEISILGCYLPLYKLNDRLPFLKSIKSTNKNFINLIKFQILEPLEEIELSKKIKKIGSINDSISKQVKIQYENNPYPRWRYGDNSKESNLSYIEVINKQIHPNSIINNFNYDQVKVLIAGCGTGNQILQSLKYRGSKITAIDLSSASLSYAQRKINNLSIQNVELIQMDLLDINLLGEKYDIIECGGVLHHMKDPIEGLKALLNVLNKNCFLKLGLYSQLARKDIIKARQYISGQDLKPTKNDMRLLREKIISNELADLNSLKSSTDFYSLSEFRDLCFHIKEHRFSVDQLNTIFISLKLKFLGFLVPEKIKSLYKNYYPEDNKQTNLKNWANFEKEFPNTFRGMYQFWVRK